MPRSHDTVPEARDPRDEQTIDRLRSALDELTDGLPTEAHSPSDPPLMVISLEDRRRERRRAVPVLAGVAAASVMVVATVAIMRDPVAAPPPADSDVDNGSDVPTSLPVPPPTTTLPPDPVPIDTARHASAPRHTLFGLEPVRAETTDPVDLTGMAWQQQDLGFIVTLQVRPGIAQGVGPVGAGYVRDHSFPYERGLAWTRGPIDMGTANGPSMLWWEQPNGDVWMLRLQWTDQGSMILDTDGGTILRQTALSIEPGSGLPYILPDDSWHVVGVQTAGLRPARAEVFDVDGTELVVLSIEGSPVSGLTNLTSDGGLGAIDVAGLPGWRATPSASGEVRVGWVSADWQWWSTVTIPAVLADRADELIASLATTSEVLTPARADLPAFVIDLPDASAGELFEFDDVEQGMVHGEFWIDASLPEPRLLGRWTMPINDSTMPIDDFTVPTDGQVDELEGVWMGVNERAWLVRPSDAARYLPIQLVWDRVDHVVILGGFRLTPDEMIAAATLTMGGIPHGPLILSEEPDRSLELIPLVGTRSAMQQWSLDTGSEGVLTGLTVHEGSPHGALVRAWRALSMDQVTVAGAPGYRAYLPDNTHVIWWQPTIDDSGAWAWLVLPPGVSHRSDEIIAAIRPAP